MRIFLLASAAALVALASPAGAATRNFGITSFTKVRVDGPFDVALKTGIAPYARASGSPAALDRVAIDVRGDTLVVHSSLDSWGGYPGKDVGPVEISLGTHDLTDAWLNGSGSLSVDRVKGLTFGMSIQGSGIADVGEANVDQLNVSVMGSGSATLGGRAAKVTAVIRGASKLDAANLSAKDATLGAEGTATISARVTNSATVDANGPSTVQLEGSPACTVRASGSASVRGCH